MTTRTIFDQTGLAYNSYARNPEAYALYRRASTHLAAQRRRGQPNRSAERAGRDPWLVWPKIKLVARLRAALQANEQLRAEPLVTIASTRTPSGTSAWLRWAGCRAGRRRQRRRPRS